MNRRSFRLISLSFASFATLMLLGSVALAGPPLICWPFEIGNAKTLPWGTEPGWRQAKADYDVHLLVGDTLSLLTSDQPVLARMETLRRATIYAMKDDGVARELYSRLIQRAQSAKGKTDALALFDAAYVVESFKQANAFGNRISAADGLDGRVLIERAIALRGGDSEMEFAAALIINDKDHERAIPHLRKAATGAAEGSLLARNLVSHFPERGKTISQLRASLSLSAN